MDNRQLHQSVHKPSREEWVRWAQVVIDRLTTCVHVYTRPPHEDVFMAEAERQSKNAKALDLLRRIHALTDEASTPTDSLADLENHDERVIAGLKILLREALNLLPELSADMQKLLKSPWFDKWNGRLAAELFRGPMGNEIEGIGSGYAENGRLPEALNDFLAEEEVGDSRFPREGLRLPRRDGSAQERRRAKGQYLRSAGRVE